MRQKDRTLRQRKRPLRISAPGCAILIERLEDGTTRIDIEHDGRAIVKEANSGTYRPPGRCQIAGCGRPALEPHTCPFRAEINDDTKTLCTCCSVCRAGCADEV
jgi:hypothetical protein